MQWVEKITQPTRDDRWDNIQGWWRNSHRGRPLVGADDSLRVQAVFRTRLGGIRLAILSYGPERRTGFAARRCSRNRLNGASRSRSASIMAIFSPNVRRAMSRRPSPLRWGVSGISGEGGFGRFIERILSFKDRRCQRDARTSAKHREAQIYGSHRKEPRYPPPLPPRTGRCAGGLSAGLLAMPLRRCAAGVARGFSRSPRLGEFQDRPHRPPRGPPHQDRSPPG